jgi:hypothetical protein
LTNLEILEPDLIWKVNGRVVEASQVVANALAMPSNIIDFNLDWVKNDRAESMYRDLTSLEIAEIQALAKLARTKRRSYVGMTLTILFVAIFGSLALFVTVESGASGAWLFLVPIGIWMASFRLGLMFDMSSFKTYRGLKLAAAIGYVVMAKEQADDGSESFVHMPEYLMESGIVWTVDGEPADWRKEYLAPFRWK